jgi:hypothetical protein
VITIFSAEISAGFVGSGVGEERADVVVIASTVSGFGVELTSCVV